MVGEEPDEKIKAMATEAFEYAVFALERHDCPIHNCGRIDNVELFDAIVRYIKACHEE